MTDIFNPIPRHDLLSVVEPALQHHLRKAPEIAQSHVQSRIGIGCLDAVKQNVGVSLRSELAPKFLGNKVRIIRIRCTLQNPTHRIGVCRYVAEFSTVSAVPFLQGRKIFVQTVRGIVAAFHPSDCFIQAVQVAGLRAVVLVELHTDAHIEQVPHGSAFI